jgi:DNA polymerase-3 subunit epsilon
VRQVVLDTETTGIDPRQGHRVIEIGAVELVDREITEGRYQQYLNPGRSSDPEALRVHGIRDDFLADQPDFADIVEDFLAFLGDAELIIHNAPFDLAFLNAELERVGRPALQNPVRDTLVEARRRHPGQKNDLDALCRRYGVDNSRRQQHGALLDCEILAEVYLRMSGGQLGMRLAADREAQGPSVAEEGQAGAPFQAHAQAADRRRPLRLRRADAAELAAHEAYLRGLGGKALWREESPGEQT